MPDLRCKKCKLEAFTKCPSERTIFPTDMAVTYYGNTVTIDKWEIDYPKGSPGYEQGLKAPRTKVSFTFVSDLDDESLAKLFHEFGRLGEDKIRKALCYHDWKWVGDEDCLFGCHKARRKAAVGKS